MEMVFCFCEACIKELDQMTTEDLMPAFLNAYSDAICANCDTQGEMADTRKFEVELVKVNEKDGVHQYTEFSVIRMIQET